jgi:hypothetical protein
MDGNQADGLPKELHRRVTARSEAAMNPFFIGFFGESSPGMLELRRFENPFQQTDNQGLSTL